MTELERWLTERIHRPDCPIHYITIYHTLFRN